ncbi:MAG: hypothetical protein ACM3ML_31240, partial [Micromonosporaceae bacterium]
MIHIRFRADPVLNPGRFAPAAMRSVFAISLARMLSARAQRNHPQPPGSDASTRTMDFLITGTSAHGQDPLHRSEERGRSCPSECP